MTDSTLPQIAVPIHGDISGIYVIRNNISGRVYVGSSAKVKARWRAHKHLLRQGKHHAPALQRSWVKHGQATFIFEIVEIVKDHSSLFEREQHWMDFFQTTSSDIGFNIHPKAGGPRGHKLSLEVRAQMSARYKGRKMPPRPPEYIEAQRISHLGKKLSPETCARMSASRTGKKLPPFSGAHRKAMSLAAKRRCARTSVVPTQMEMPV
jgi:group I intron endonuclease